MVVGVTIAGHRDVGEETMDEPGYFQLENFGPAMSLIFRDAA